MKRQGDKTGVDHVLHLYLTACESDTDSLEEFIERYPNYEDELREFAAFSRIDDAVPDRTYTDEEEQLLNARAISVVQNTIYESLNADKGMQNATTKVPRGARSKAVAATCTPLEKTDTQTGPLKPYVSQDLSRRHIARAVLSAEIVSRLWREPTFGRVKHQKVFHLCEYVAQLEEIRGEYRRDAAGPLDNKLIYSVEAELKKQKWFETYELKPYGHGYRPLSKTGGHQQYFIRWWPQKSETVVSMIELMRSWKTQRCEILNTVYAAWNDLIIWGKPVTDDSILTEVLERWHEQKKSIAEQRWRDAISWMREKNLVPTGFGRATTNRK